MQRSRQPTVAIVIMMCLPLLAGELSKREKARKTLNDKYDRLRLRYKNHFVKDRSEHFLEPPEGVEIEGEFTIATAPPVVKLQILPDLVPEYFSGEAQYMTCWANWANVLRSPDNRFYFPASDHLASGCHINLYEYRPEDEVIEKVLDVEKLLGWTDDMYTDGKIHGEMGILPDGTLWACTHYGSRRPRSGSKLDTEVAGFSATTSTPVKPRTGASLLSATLSPASQSTPAEAYSPGPATNIPS